MYKTLCLLAIGLATLGAGCKSTTTSPNGSTTSTIVTPGEGSSFLLYHEERDSTGKVTDSGTDTEKVYLTGLPLFGKTNVMELITNRPGSSGIEYINYESNGDVTSDSSAYGDGPASIIEGQGGINKITYPFASQVSNKTYGFDTTDGKGGRVKLAINFAGSGQGTTPINGQAVATEKVTATLNYTVGLTNYTETIILSFAPSLGVIVEKTVLSGGIQTGHEVVTSYKLIS